MGVAKRNNINFKELDYYPFGSEKPGRSFASGNYKYGYQNQEKDDEIKGEGNSYSFEYRIHDPRLGKFLSVDPLSASYPWNSPYAFAENRVIDGIELEGLEWQPTDDKGNNVATDANNISDYKWVGYNCDSETHNWSAPEGTVANASIWTGENSMRFYSSSGTPNSVEINGEVTDLTITDQPSLDKINNLHPDIQSLVKEFMLRSEFELKLQIRIVQGLRTYDEQNNLYSQGRNQAQLNAVGLNNVQALPNLPLVTNARGGYSNHNFGLAIDVAFLEPGGTINWSIANYNRLAPLGERLGFDWGGSWASLIDRPHFEMMFGNSLSQLRQKINTGNTILNNGNTYPNVDN